MALLVVELPSTDRVSPLALLVFEPAEALAFDTALVATPVTSVTVAS
ncbi:hypothetical protein ACS60S_02655 [Streptococcus suis]|nr:hypothetical protein [Streptococcus suis]MDG4500774.1 hypothetical protein [Streptococcus suis]